MLYSLLTFFGVQYFLGNIWLSATLSIVTYMIENTVIKKKDCNCNTSKKPQIDV